MSRADLNRLPKNCSACGAPGEWVWNSSKAEWAFERKPDSVENLSDAIELVLDECQAWSDDDGVLEARFGSPEAAALRKLAEAYTAVHRSSASDGESSAT